VKTKVLQIQRITLTSQETIRELENRQRELQHEFRQLGKHAEQSLEQTKAYLKQREADIDARLVPIHVEQRQNFAALQATFTSSMQPLTQMEQMSLALNRQTQMQQHLVGNAQIPFYNPATSRNKSAVRISATIPSQQCSRSCSCQCHTRASILTPLWLRNMFGQLFWTYSSSISMRSCNYPPCRKRLGKHHFTYYFPPWLVSRAICSLRKSR